MEKLQPFIMIHLTNSITTDSPPTYINDDEMRNLLWSLNGTVQSQIFTSSWISLVRPFICSEKHFRLNPTQ